MFIKCKYLTCYDMYILNDSDFQINQACSLSKSSRRIAGEK